MTTQLDIIGIAQNIVNGKIEHGNTDKALAEALLEREELREYVVLLFGAEKGQEANILHLKRLMQFAVHGWTKKSKRLEEKLRIAEEAMDDVEPLVRRQPEIHVAGSLHDEAVARYERFRTARARLAPPLPPKHDAR